MPNFLLDVTLVPVIVAPVTDIGNYDLGVWIPADALDDPARPINTLDSALRQKANQ